MAKDGCRWVIIDADECNGVYGHGGGEKQDKKSPKCVSRACFAMHSQGQKMHHAHKDDCGVQGGSRGEIKGK